MSARLVVAACAVALLAAAPLAAQQDTGMMAHDTGMMAHDTGMMAHDTGMMSHDSAMMGHDSTMMGHDSTMMGHDGGMMDHDGGTMAPDSGAIGRGTSMKLDRRPGTEEGIEQRAVATASRHAPNAVGR